MIPVLIIVGLVVLYELNVQRSGGAGAGSGVSSYNESVSGPSSSLGAQFQEESTGASAASKALGFIPIVGPVIASAFNAITGGLIAASQKRAKQAISENQAVAAAVPGWDAAVAQIAKGYNNGQLTADQVLSMLASPQTAKAGLTSGSNGMLWSNYWSEVSPQIQPGRNGCQSGTVPHTVSFCGGSHGAACCVGYDNLDNSQLYMAQAVIQAEQNGKGTGNVVQVFASKYGGINRGAYTVTFTKPGPIASLTGGFLQSIGL